MPRTGHFRFESGHHGNLWLDLSSLFLRPKSLCPFVAEIAKRLSAYEIEAVCGPVAGGAFLAQMIANELDLEFHFTERVAGPPVVYRLATEMGSRIAGRRVAVVDDAINAGSAVRGTIAELRAYGAVVVALGALLVLGDAAKQVAGTLPVEHLARLDAGLWEPEACPLCAAGVPIDNPCG